MVLFDIEKGCKREKGAVEQRKKRTTLQTTGTEGGKRKNLAGKNRSVYF